VPDLFHLHHVPRTGDNLGVRREHGDARPG
jgi:hypothetical protein